MVDILLASPRLPCVGVVRTSMRKSLSYEEVYKPRGSLLYSPIGLSVYGIVIWLVVMGANNGGMYKPGQDLAAIP